MNTLQIYNMCKNIYADYLGMQRKALPEDLLILDTIIHLYNTTDIDHEEVKWLWVGYLDTGNLYVSEAIEMARVRIAYAIRKQRMEWLDK